MAGGRSSWNKLTGTGAYDEGTGRSSMNKLLGTGAYGPNAKKTVARAPAPSSPPPKTDRAPSRTRVRSSSGGAYTKPPTTAVAAAPAKKKADTRVASTKAPAPAPRRSAADILGLSEDNAVMKRLRAREKGTQVAAMNKGGYVKGKKGKC